MKSATLSLCGILIVVSATASAEFAPDQAKAKKWSEKTPALVEKVKEEKRFERSKRLWDMKLGLDQVEHSYFLLDSPIIKKEENLFQPVRFTHLQHASWIKNCNACHHARPADPKASEVTRCSACHQQAFNPKIPGRIGLKAAYHRQCLGCHQTMNRGPADCLGCHAKNSKNHQDLVKLPANPSPQDVSKECTRCHANSVSEMQDSAHWAKKLPSDKNHVSTPDGSVDCLVCHDTSGNYKKSDAAPSPATLLSAAKSAGSANRDNCGQCHFQSKDNPNSFYSDLTPDLKKADRSHDIHMGGYDFKCQECHQTRRHKISGQSSITGVSEGRTSCEQCHGKTPHGDGALDHHLNKHVDHMVCTTCHSPLYGKDSPTIASWDWSKAANKPGLKHGEITWRKNNKPVYLWSDGNSKNNMPEGDIRDPNSRIAPFEVVKVRRPVDAETKKPLEPKLSGPNGFWATGDWNKTLGRKFAWADTTLYKGIQHEVTPKEMALSCVQCHPSLSQGCVQCHSNYSTKRTCNRCHQDNKGFSFKKLAEKGMNFDKYYHRGRESMKYIQTSDYLDFEKLGYKGDPVVTGGRQKKLPLGYEK